MSLSHSCHCLGLTSFPVFYNEKPVLRSQSLYFFAYSEFCVFLALVKKIYSCILTKEYFFIVF